MSSHREADCPVNGCRECMPGIELVEAEWKTRTQQAEAERDDLWRELGRMYDLMTNGEAAEFHGQRAIKGYQRTAELAVDEKRQAEARVEEAWKALDGIEFVSSLAEHQERIRRAKAALHPQQTEGEG